MKGSKSTSCLPTVTMFTVPESELGASGGMGVLNSDVGSQMSHQEIKTPELSILSDFGANDGDHEFKPSPVIGNVHLLAKTRIPFGANSTEKGSTARSVAIDGMLPSESNYQLPVISTMSESHRSKTELVLPPEVPDVCSSASPLLGKLHDGRNKAAEFDFGFVSLTNSNQTGNRESHSATNSSMNTTELLEDIEPVECSINATFAITPAKALNVTMDLPSSTCILNTTVDLPNRTTDITPCTSVLSATKAFKDADLRGPNIEIHKDVPPSSNKVLNTTIDIGATKCGQSDTVASLTAQAFSTNDTKEKTASKELFPAQTLDSTYCVENDSPGMV